MTSRPAPISIESDNYTPPTLVVPKTIGERTASTTRKNIRQKCKIMAAYKYTRKQNKLKREKCRKEKDKFFKQIHEIETNNSNFNIINAGMFGKIYLNNDDVCIKVIKFKNINKFNYNKNKTSYLLKKTEEFKEFKDENRNIIKFFNYGYSRCTPHELKLYIQTEYINGKILVCHFQEIDPILCLKQICDGLHYLQENYEFIHNDIKSSNIMAIINSKSNLIIKIIDIDGGDTIKNLKKSKEIFGTPLYFSPEKLLLCSSFKNEFNECFSPKTSFERLPDFEKINYLKKQDIYSIGVVFFELIYGINIHTQIGTFVKFPGEIKKFYFRETQFSNAYDVFIKNYKNSYKEKYKELNVKLESNLEKYNYSSDNIDNLLRELLTFHERKNLNACIKQITNIIDSNTRGGNNTSFNKSTTSSSITATSSSSFDSNTNVNSYNNVIHEISDKDKDKIRNFYAKNEDLFKSNFFEESKKQKK